MCLWLCVCLQGSLTVIKVSVVVGIASTFDIGAFPACRAELRNALGHMWRSWEMNFREGGTLAKFSCLISLLGKWGCNCIAFETLLDKSHLAKNRVHGFHFPLRYDWRLQKNDSVMLVNLTLRQLYLSGVIIHGCGAGLRMNRLGNLKYTNQMQNLVFENHMRPISRLWARKYGCWILHVH